MHPLLLIPCILYVLWLIVCAYAIHVLCAEFMQAYMYTLCTSSPKGMPRKGWIMRHIDEVYVPRKGWMHRWPVGKNDRLCISTGISMYMCMHSRSSGHELPLLELKICTWIWCYDDLHGWIDECIGSIFVSWISRCRLWVINLLSFSSPLSPLPSQISRLHGVEVGA